MDAHRKTVTCAEDMTPDYPTFARTFADDGVLVVQSFFAPAQIEEIEEQLNRYISDLEQTGADKSAVCEPGAERQLRNLFHMEKYSGYFAELAQAPQLVNLA